MKIVLGFRRRLAYRLTVALHVPQIYKFKKREDHILMLQRYKHIQTCKFKLTCALFFLLKEIINAAEQAQKN